jgi:hypothetical protein
MWIARIFPSMLVVVSLSADACAPAFAQSGNIVGVGSQPVRVAELVQSKKHARELAQRKHTKYQAQGGNAHIVRHKKPQPEEVASEPGTNSILFRLAPYNYTLG